MNLQELQRYLKKYNVVLSAKDGELLVRADQGVLNKSVVEGLKQYKSNLLEIYKSNGQEPANNNRVVSITPEMLPLVDIDQGEIDLIIASMPKGAANIQDVYPLAPMQEGIFFHSLMQAQGDIYIQRTILSFSERKNLDQFLVCLQMVIDRHDILRTAIFWEGLSRPLQVVSRKAKLQAIELSKNPNCSVNDHLLTESNPSKQRFDFKLAPLMKVYFIHNESCGEYQLALLNHHIIGDHLTLGSIIKEIQEIMNGKSELLAPSLPYRNFIAQLRSISKAEYESYFRGQLGDKCEPTAPFDITEFQECNENFREIKVVLDETLDKQIRLASKHNGTTPAVLFHAAWGLVLAKCCRLDDVVMGSVLSGRSQISKNEEQVLGMFINTLPLRLTLHDHSVKSYIDHVQNNLTQLLMYEQAPLAEVQRCSAVLAPKPLFTTLFNYRYRQYDGNIFSLHGMQIISVDERTNYPIGVSIDDTGKQFELIAQCVLGIDPERMANYLMTAVDHISSALLRNSALPVLELDILSSKERSMLINELGASDNLTIRETTIQALFEKHANKNPNNNAVIFNDAQLTYKELNQKSNYLAHSLINMGICPGDRVALCVERGIDMIVAILGIFKSGGVYVPLDSTYPMQRLKYILKDSNPAVILSQKSLKNTLANIFYSKPNIPVILLDERSKTECLNIIESYNPDPQALGLGPEDLAYIIYTSGTTGQPKGVMVRHGNILSSTLARIHAGKKYERCLQINSTAFDGSIAEILGTLSCSGCLYLMSRDEVQDPELIAKAIQKYKITTILSIPSLIRLVIDFLKGSEHSLKHITVAGEVCPVSLKQNVDELGGGIDLVNEYGPTEATVWASAYHYKDKVQNSVPIGRPIANTRLYILNDRHQLVPQGVIGELYIGGQGVSKGYQNQDRLTAERFVQNPYGSCAEDRLYKTGDLVRWRDDGNLEFIGRDDTQVKIRGFRIELGEIENQILAYGAVKETVVIIREEQGDHKRLTAYIVPSKDMDISALRKHLTKHLPEYMLPKAFIVLNELPRTANGKLNFRDLPALGQDSIITNEYAEPEGEVEGLIGDLYKELLGLERVGRFDHFFELGGHSLLAVQLISRVRRSFEVEVALRDIFSSPRLMDFSRVVDNAKKSEQARIPKADRTKPLIVSWSQQRLWFLHKLDDAASAAYHIPSALRLKGDLSRDILRACLDRIVDRHESLRTVFKSDGDRVCQVVTAKESGFDLSEHDLSGLKTGMQNKNLQKIIADETDAAFDLEEGPLIRGCLLRLSEQEHILLITQHHIISDGWSISVLVNEVSVLYDAFGKGLQDPLPELAIQYCDYAAWQRSSLHENRLNAQLDYWCKHLKSAPALLALPTDYLRPSKQSYRGHQQAFNISKDLTERLRDFSKKNDVTLFMSMLAAWSILLFRISKQSDIVVGTPVANRQHADTEGLIGFFVNTLALNLQLSSDVSVSDMLMIVKKCALAAYDHQDIPFEQIVEALQPPRSLSYSPLFQVLFTFNNIPNQAKPILSGIDLSPLDLPHRTTQFDLSLTLNETDSGLQGFLEYAEDLFGQDTIERFIGYYQMLLKNMILDGSQKVSQIPMMGDKERKKILTEINSEPTDYRQDSLVQKLYTPKDSSCRDTIEPLNCDYALLFSRQVAKHPNKTAAICEGETISYSELDRRSNRLAMALVDSGVQTDQIIVLIDKRGISLLTMMIAVLKSGAAFLSLDINHPLERLLSIVQQSQSSLCLYSEPFTYLYEELKTSCAQLKNGLLSEQWMLKENVDQFQSKGLSGNLAYVVYTSGSTGTPKGALIEQRGMLNNILGKVPTIGLNERDIIAQTASPAFDISVWQFLAAPVLGATVHIVSEPVMRNPKALLQEIENHCITILEIVPSLMRSLLDTCSSDIKLNTLRWLLPTGESLSLKLCQDWFDRFPNISLMNLYGPAECSDDVAYYPISKRPADNSLIPIGRPTPNSQLYILDDQLQLAPIGVIGEICIGGVGVGRGYLNDPERTEGSFIENPFDKGKRLYRSGDLGRYLPDGNIEFCGRNDFQVKIRGFRIELGEIENKLMQCQAVHAALVDLRGVQNNKRLVAYLIIESSHALDKARLRAELLNLLPDYMVPSAFVEVADFPLNSNGKIDRNALPEPDLSALIVREYVQPKTQIEILLADIWGDLLDLERVGAEDHFFELGGHSLLIISLIERLRQRGYHLDVQSVFVLPELSVMAKCIEEKSKANKKPTIPKNLIANGCTQITPEYLPLLDISQAEIDTIVKKVPLGIGNIQDIYPLAPLQEGILFHYLLQNQGDPYLLRLELEFNNRENLDKFLFALQQVINRHDILRSAVHWEGISRPVQVVQNTATLFVEEIDLSRSDDFSRQFFNLSNPAKQRIDLRQAPLLKALIARKAETGQWRLALLNHHMVCDHLTQSQIICEIKLILQDLQEELPPAFPFRNFIAQTLAGSMQEHEAYFSEQLHNIDEPTAPFGLVSIQADSEDMIKSSIKLDEEYSRLIRKQASLRGTTSAVLFHIAWAQVLSQCCDQSEVVMGTVLLGRNLGVEGSDQALGMFMNTLPLKVSLQEHTAAEIVKQVHANLSRLLLHEQASLSIAQRCSGVPAETPLFTSLINYRHNPVKGLLSEDDLERIGMRVIDGEERTNYPFTVDIDDNEDGYSISVQCIKSVSAENMANYINKAMQQLLLALQNGYQEPLASFTVMPDQEYKKIVYDFNNTESSQPKNHTILELFEKQTERYANTTAVSFANKHITYADLNKKSNRLAHYLLSLGVKPDDRIAICCERSIEMVIGILGILKSGGAYVPLDPSYPIERLEYMLRDCLPKALLTFEQIAEQVFSDISNRKMDIPVLCLDGESAEKSLSPYADSNPDYMKIGLTEDHLAYMIYTSGSTGKAKGVGVQHGGFGNLMSWYQKEFSFSDKDHNLLLTSFSFDLTQKNFFIGLLTGGRLYLSDPVFDPSAIVSEIRNKHISRINLTPSAFYALLEAHNIDDFASLRSVFLGGEPINVEQFLCLRESYPELEIINTYGPTECTDVTTYYRLEYDWKIYREKVLPIGRPIANTQHYILDTKLRPVPIGVVGEIFISGAAVSRGYLNQTQMTAKRFLNHPFAREGKRLYRTGDMGRYREDGCIEYLGRNDFQVKLRGFRIELGEIESQLNICDGVQDSAVMIKENTQGSKLLVAYIITENREDIPVQSLHQHLAKYLPEYMIPNIFMRVEAFPLTPSGKLDRSALPDIDQKYLISRAYAAPEGEIEVLLADIWMKLFGLEKIGRNDHFFELGGHSLLAIQLSSRIQEKFHIDLPLGNLFEAPILFELATKIQSMQVEFFLGEEIEDIEAELDDLSEDELIEILTEGEVNES